MATIPEDSPLQVNGHAGSKETMNGERSPAAATTLQQQQSSSPAAKAPSKLDLLRKRVKSEKKPPAGGFDATPVPKVEPGFTVRFTFHRASNLPTADLNSLSSDPFVVAHLRVAVPTRHKEDPPLRFRTPTVHRSRHPVWNADWVVANVPATGFQLKMRIYDEDPANHDDRLGNAHLAMQRLSEDWTGLRKEELKIKKRMTSKRAWVVTGCLALASSRSRLHGRLVVSVDVLGRTEGPSRKLYTVGPQYWSQHFSPLMGRLAGTKVPGEKGKAERYNFPANEIQMHGPVPDEMYHRYVEFKPFIKGTFTKAGLRGRILNRAMHHQHARVYNYDRSTIYGVFREPRTDLTLQFLKMVHYDQGSRLFTYVLTLDGLFRFTETGKEFGIDMLSKHSMHSDISVYIAFSGEFLVRRHRPSRRNRTQTQSSLMTLASTSSSSPLGLPPKHTPSSSSKHSPPSPASPNHDDSNINVTANDVQNEKEADDHDDPPQDPSCYELIIDNDSGTYRPNAKYLNLLHDFFAANFPGLRIRVMACDDERLVKLKQAQRERKKKSGDARMYVQVNGSDSSFSSSDEESLEEATASARANANGGVGNAQGDGAVDGDDDRATVSKLEKGLKLVTEPKGAVREWVHREKGKGKGKEKSGSSDGDDSRQTTAGSSTTMKEDSNPNNLEHATKKEKEKEDASSAAA